MIEPQNPNIAEIERLYREKYHPLYEEFAYRLHILLEELTNKASIPIDRIEHRVKTVESFLKKIERNKLYDSPFEQIKDCAGVRIITYYHDDVYKVTEILRKELNIDEMFSGDKSYDPETYKFGYRSVHLKITLSTHRSALKEWARYDGLFAEIQVRSILQHAWAVIGHKIAYKSKASPSSEFERRLAHLSATLEEADEKFIMLRDLSKRVAKEVKNEIDQNETNLPLNLDTLQRFVNHRMNLQKWEQFGVQAGMEPFPQLVNKNYSIGLEILVLTLKAVGISSTVEFENLFPGFGKMTKHVRRFVDLVKSKGETIQAVPVDVLIFLVSFSKPNGIPMNFDWGGKYHPFIIEALREVCKELSDS